VIGGAADGTPLAGVRVLDFSTLLPGPLASLILAEAGAEVIRIERPGRGDDMRHYAPGFGTDGANFALLNRGKRSLTFDLKNPDAIGRLKPLIESADIVIEQFRPGVMDRLGLGYEAVKAMNPRLVYCSITGYGQDGPRAGVAAHDLNYIAETGVLAITAGPDGAPVVPPVLVADIAAGSYPAVMNIMFALFRRERSGEGAYLDVSMTDNLFPLLYWALGSGFATGHWPVPGGELVSGGSPRYQIYRTNDDRFVAAAPLEDKFWTAFCDIIGLPKALRDDSRDAQATKEEIARLIRARSAAEWADRFRGVDCCATVMATIEEAVQDPHFIARGLFARTVVSEEGRIPALPVPVIPPLRRPEQELGYPVLGEADADFLEPGNRS